MEVQRSGEKVACSIHDHSSFVKTVWKHNICVALNKEKTIDKKTIQANYSEFLILSIVYVYIFTANVNNSQIKNKSYNRAKSVIDYVIHVKPAFLCYNLENFNW